MREYTEVPRTVIDLEISYISCDVCGNSFDVDIDIFDVQAFIHIKHQSGYGSVFGDGNTWSIDICQDCFKKVFGKYIKVQEGV